MTGWGQLSHRAQIALDRLAWGFGDFKRVLLERGAWPAAAGAAVAADGGRWSVTGTRARQRADTAVSDRAARPARRGQRRGAGQFADQRLHLQPQRRERCRSRRRWRVRAHRQMGSFEFSRQRLRGPVEVRTWRSRTITLFPRSRGQTYRRWSMRTPLGCA